MLARASGGGVVFVVESEVEVPPADRPSSVPTSIRPPGWGTQAKGGAASGRGCTLFLDQVCPEQEVLARGQLVGYFPQEQLTALGLEIANRTAQENNQSWTSSRQVPKMSVKVTDDPGN